MLQGVPQKFCLVVPRDCLPGGSTAGPRHPHLHTTFYNKTERVFTGLLVITSTNSIYAATS